jgi:hypothetical protein
MSACVSENVSIGIRGPLVVLSHALMADNHMRDSAVLVLHKVIAYFDMTISDTYVHLRRKASNASSKYHFDDFHSSHLSACGARRGILSSPYSYGELVGNQVADGDRLLNGRRPRTPSCDSLSGDSFVHHQL